MPQACVRKQLLMSATCGILSLYLARSLLRANLDILALVCVASKLVNVRLVRSRVMK